jgi:peptidoglycan-N-acetylglucosamine deacetylase
MKHLIILGALLLLVCFLPSCGYHSDHPPNQSQAIIPNGNSESLIPESMNEAVLQDGLSPKRESTNAKQPIVPSDRRVKSQTLITNSAKLDNPQSAKPEAKIKSKEKANPGRIKPGASPSTKKIKSERREPKKSVPVGQHRMAQKSLSLSELRMKYPGSFKLSGPATEKKVALTFDDGPDEMYTRQVLDVLKMNKVKATFFVIGRRAEAHPELIARMIREGHIVGNHSYSHADLTKLSLSSFEKQIEHTQSILKPIIGYSPRLLRPPYGAINEQQVRWAMDHGYLIVNWSVDSLDWKGLNAEKVSGNILSANRPGAIILQHSGGGKGEDLSGTVKALPTIIRTLKSQGYDIVTVPELLHVSKNK